ncbi:hypothetical protein T4D_15015 [Trichinella pseudospiralis]|uniref:Uncharacterized protein n=1 Tax=Trichinella pseudospiralis TaxID=6337 RepID=A0A0V1F5P5_TRIPS|nr:hypothetical protein T4D_15015 [Trichinella pseudospiralis]
MDETMNAFVWWLYDVIWSYLWHLLLILVSMKSTLILNNSLFVDKTLSIEDSSGT